MNPSNVLAKENVPLAPSTSRDGETGVGPAAARTEPAVPEVATPRDGSLKPTKKPMDPSLREEQTPPKVLDVASLAAVENTTERCQVRLRIVPMEMDLAAKRSRRQNILDRFRASELKKGASPAAQ